MTCTAFTNLQAVVFDWAGTVVDCGCVGPAQAFVDGFAAHGLRVTLPEARGPMGMDKRKHVETLFALERVAEQWRALHGRNPDEAAIDVLYEEVRQRMLDTIAQYSVPIPGAARAVAAMRRRGLRIGSCTGYPRVVADKMAAVAAQLGYEPDCLVCATDVAESRPAPDMCREILKIFAISNPRHAVKIGDTTQDILEGKNAGMWTIGITLTSSITGLSAEELRLLTPQGRDAAQEAARRELTLAGADFLATDLPACLPLLEDIDAALPRDGGSGHDTQ